MTKMKKCECCGRLFRPSGTGQRFCSITCAEITLSRMESLQSALEPVAKVSNADYLTFSNAAILMGCSRQYIYKLVAEGRLSASRISSRMAFIRRADIEAMLANNPYHRVLPFTAARKKITNKKTDICPSADNDNASCNIEVLKTAVPFGSITASSSAVPSAVSLTSDDLVTIEEAVEKYHVSNTTIYNRVRINSVPTCRVAGKTYYSRQHLDEVFRDHATSDSAGKAVVTADGDIEWLTYKDAEDLFCRRGSALRSLICRHKIPTCIINGKKHCSKTHIEKYLSSRNSGI